MMIRCETIEELEEELQILNNRMAGIQVKLSGFQGQGANTTREDVMNTRQEFLEVRSEQVIRSYEIEESLPSGIVTSGSIDRAVQRIQREC